MGAALMLNCSNSSKHQSWGRHRSGLRELREVLIGGSEVRGDHRHSLLGVTRLEGLLVAVWKKTHAQEAMHSRAIPEQDGNWKIPAQLDDRNLLPVPFD